MKKRILIPLLIILILLAFLAWRHLTQDGGGVAIDTSGDTVINTLPFGTYEGIFTPGEETGDEDVVPVIDSQGNPAERLLHISRIPVAGAVAINQGGKTVIRYVDRATGHIYDVDTATLEKSKVTNRTIPKVYEAYFRKDGNAVLLRTLQNDTDTVENTVLTLTPPKSTSTDSLYNISASSILKSDMGDVAVSSSTIYYTLTDSGTINSSDFSSNSLKTLFNSKFISWRLSSSDKGPVISTKPSSQASGYSYLLSASGVLDKIIGPLFGLTTLPDSNFSRFLYSYVSEGKVKLATHVSSNSSDIETGPATLSEKCVWSSSAVGIVFCGSPNREIASSEQDGWYKGQVHFSDQVWRVETESQIADLLLDPKREYSLNIDIFNPQLSPKEDYLLFQNKTDLSLWALKLD